MIDKAIYDFISGLKEELNTPEKFIPNVALNAKYITCATHPCQFSHPYANQDKNFKITPIVFFGSASADGYIRSGNIKSKRNIDMYGSAGYATIMKFLATPMSNGKTVLDNIREDTPEGKELLSSSGNSATELREQILQVFKPCKDTHVTSSKIKQVYFTLGNGQYHILSLLTPSALVYELKNRISAIKDDAKDKKELIRKGEGATTGSFREIYNLTTLKYGGTQPQNISQLNTENGGITKLLFSAPPTLEDHKIRLPRRDFFSECLNKRTFKWEFSRLLKLITLPKDSPIPLEKQRKFRDRIFEEIILSISERMFIVRAALINIPSTLKISQQIWLSKDETLRAQNNSWESEIQNDMARWIIENLKREHSVVLGDAEMVEIKNIIDSYRDLWK